MTPMQIDSARTYLYCEGRLLEQRMFEVAFEGADAEGALVALRGFQNADGGFGHGLEPDKRAPGSQPLDVEVAFQVMDDIGRVDTGLVLDACGFLDDVGDAGAVGCLRPGFDRYPHAPHWEQWAVAPGLNPTAGLVALLWKWGVEHPWREKATAFCRLQIETALPDDAHTFGEVLAFLACVGGKDEELGKSLVPGLRARIGTLALFRLDVSEPGYGLTPLHFAPTPESIWTGLFEAAVIESHLDALAAAQQPDGGWPISWETCGTTAVNEWRGHETLRALRTLRAYGRL
jgi:hypothetical protein